MAKYRVTPCIYRLELAPREFENLDAAEAYVREFPPDNDTALDLVATEGDDLEMRYVISEHVRNNQYMFLGTVEDGDGWFEDEEDNAEVAES